MRRHDPPPPSGVPDTRKEEAALKEHKRRAEAEAAAKREADFLQQQSILNDAVQKIRSTRDRAISEHKRVRDQMVTPLNARVQELHSEREVLTIRNALESIEEMKRTFEPHDPFRLINGTNRYAKGEDWHVFRGKVLEVHPDGICIYGSFGPPFEDSGDDREYFVHSFPYKAADGEMITSDLKFTAFYDFHDSIYTYTNTFNTLRGGVRTWRKLNYGKVIKPGRDEARKLRDQHTIPPRESGTKAAIELAKVEKQIQTIQEKIRNENNLLAERIQSAEIEYDKEIAALPERMAKQRQSEITARKQETQSKVLAWHQELAARGDAYGQLRMGERYLTGEDVEIDVIKAVEFLRASAAQGNTTASNLLTSKLNLPVTIIEEAASPP
ncbi:MAG TPA: hypothetical protein PKA41_08755 [Verrucomicrobiota bacterium]|nr:hypothetical protein [Verrucomicrobiota bacterium]